MVTSPLASIFFYLFFVFYSFEILLKADRAFKLFNYKNVNKIIISFNDKIYIIESIFG